MENFLETYPIFEEGPTKTVEPGMPAELAALLDQVNSNSYANGFFKFAAPQQLRPYCALWSLDPDECFPFLKSAFGHLILFHEGQYKAINPVFNDIDLLGEQDELDFVMNVLLCDRSSLEASFFIDIYEQTFPRLGPPKLDEIYAFVPALGLGGSQTAENVQKVNMEQQMLILSQL